MENNQEEKGVTLVDISKEMRGAYLQYSMSVIVGRALPDVRDGLKPVHRRVLFAQSEMNNRHNRPYLKSARVVGDVIGKYHPHGDASVYDTMVRMAQDFSLRYPLEDGQGNFGSIDGDSPAAMRYTEIRLTALAEELLNDLEKETVSFGPNYDDSLLIPTVLPSKFPNLLVNGSAGIAVGMATNIPPHNLGEVIDGCIHLIGNPDCQIEDLMQHIKGPDFPTCGVIAGREGILQAYKKGRGIVTIKAVAEIVQVKDREEIIITEIPYQVNKAKLIESMADLVRDKQIEGISDIRDESSREGMRIVVVLKRGENASVILNRLYKYTQMQTSFGIIMLALDAKNQPVTFDLKGMLEAFVDHRRDVVTKRCIFELKKAQERAHILEGLKKALDHIEEVIKTIRASKEANAAREALMSKFEFSERQAVAILEMRLQRLTGLERDKIVAELAELMKQIDWLKFVLSDVREIYKIIVSELEDVKKRYADPRRTQITGDLSDLEDEDLIADEQMVVTVTNTGLIKRIPVEEYRVQKRGGKGLKGMETKEEDYVTDIFSASTKTMLLVFTDKGKVYWCKVHRLPLGTRTSKGKSLANVVQLSNGESVRAILPVNEFSENKYAVMLTEKGVIKKTSLDAFANPRTAGIIALTTDLDDGVIDVKISDGQSDIFIATKEGMSIRFNEADVREMGRTARGVKAITLAKDDVVVAMEVLEKNTKDTILMVTSKGYGKRSETGEYRIQSRGGVGIITQKTTEKVGLVIGTKKVADNMELILSTDKGQVIRMKVTDISVLGRNTQGVRLINIDEKDETVTGVAVVAEDETATEETPAPEGAPH
ncbi:DNA gyrase subunit A [Bdellovibrio bacteriovorus]|uniref:DNA gyrase subunit A n=1 Tax=Bdellovibrio bacteriovorus TaxID=959 RepID=UPI00045C0390|nr:DNA gyrase subunit A [Bdellovibrio bacteriovorus]AHZ85666.1 DNA gyrase subunit A [Bdellovibrio bacteriovorus]BEV66585.1 DNA gyrase subunit A [Bdellovibrio bacteriovorus]